MASELLLGTFPSSVHCSRFQGPLHSLTLGTLARSASTGTGAQAFQGHTELTGDSA